MDLADGGARVGMSEVRQHIVSLGYEAVPILIKFLNDGNRGHELMAAGLLVQIGTASAVGGLTDKIAATVDDVAYRRSLRRYLREVRNPASVDVLLERLAHSEQTDVSLDVEHVLRSLKGGAVVSALQRHVETSGSPRSSKVAARLLGQISDPDAVSQLVQSCRSSSSETARMAAAVALVQVGTAEALDALVDCESFLSPGVLVDAFSHITKNTSTEYLFGLIRSPRSTQAQVAAAVAIQKRASVELLASVRATASTIAPGKAKDILQGIIDAYSEGNRLQGAIGSGDGRQTSPSVGQ